GGIGGAVSPGERVSGRTAGSQFACAYNRTPRGRSKSALALHPAVQFRYSVRADERPAVRGSVCRQQRYQAERLPQPQPARSDHQRERLAVGGRQTIPGVRRYSVDGESSDVQLQLSAGEIGEAIFAWFVSADQLHLG